MKVYRIIPDSFTVRNYIEDINGLNENEVICTEDIYYNMGYVSLSNKKYRYANKIITMLINSKNGDLNKMGRYFYIFPEDAISYGPQALRGLRDFSFGCARLVEYDIPDELIMKYYGCGTYEGNLNDYVAECYLTEDDFNGKVISSNELSIEDKRIGLIKSLKQTINSLIELKGNESIKPFRYLEAYRYFSNLFSVEDLNEIINDENKLKEVLFNSIYYESFIEKEKFLVETKYITSKVLSLPFRNFNYTFGSTNVEFFKEKDFDVDFSEEKYGFRRGLAYYDSSKMNEEDKQYVLNMIRKRGD